MQNFKLQRVLVRASLHAVKDEFIEIIPPITGTVVRLRKSDNGAWVALDRRATADVHPFAADDPHGRGVNVLAYPDGCDEIQETRP